MTHRSHSRGRSRLIFHETRWLMSLRWGAGVVIMLLGLANWLWLDHAKHGLLPVAVGVTVLGYNALFEYSLRKWPGLVYRFESLLFFGSVQIYLDIACLTILTLWTGGLHSPVMYAFFLHMVFAGLLQPQARAVAIALVAVAALGVGLWSSNQQPRTSSEWLSTGAWATVLVLVVYLTDRISRSLYRREETIIRQAARNHAMWARHKAQQATMAQGEKMAAMGQLVAGIAHEITNPLASMDSLLQLMQRHPSQPRPQAVDTLREQVERILRIIRQLTAFAHPGRGMVESVRVEDLIRSSLDMLSFNRKMERVELTCDFAESGASVRINGHALQQVLTNLIVNALDATASVEKPRIHVGTRTLPGLCVVEVSDNGTGISPEHLSKVFEPFFTTKPVGKGTGLGLSICSRLIREQGGSIDVRSEPGKGTTFTVSLPDQSDSHSRRHDSTLVSSTPQ